MKAILAGASGLTGSQLALVLAAVSGSEVTALVRKPTDPLPKGIEQKVCDFSHLEQLPETSAQSVFCALGTTIAKAGSREAFRQIDHEAVIALGQYGRRCGASQFLLVSSVGASLTSWNFYLRVKAETERDLASLGYECLHIFRPSFLLGDRREPRPGEALGIAAARALGWVLAGPLSPYRGIEASTVARAMVKASGVGVRGVRIYHYDEIVAMAGSRA